MSISKIYQTAVEKGGQILTDGRVYTKRPSIRVPNRTIERFIEPNGNYLILINQEGVLTKRIYKYHLNNNSTLTDSWDFIKNRGVHLSTVITNQGKSFMSRVFDKVGELKIKQDGVIYMHHKGNPDRYITDVKTLNGITSTPKPFSPMGWLNNEFYKYFNREN